MSSRGLVATLGAAAFLLSACGASEPEPLTAMQPDAPADLCATVPAAAKSGLQSAATSDTDGDPTAACSLRSAPGAKPEVRAIVTWLQLDDDGSADTVLESQCRAIDKSVYTQASSTTIPDSDQTCAASGKLGSADAATLATVTGRTVVTVRWSAQPGDDVMQRAVTVAQSLVSELADKS